MTRVAISGTIGVGKSTFSKTLAEAIGFSLIVRAGVILGKFECKGPIVSL